ncbi:MAG: hypothetical protein A3B96_04355 [Candidatus Spechtbacteria bacterium RIFCSPHIGHO2_02_FULL_43_15b]|nr:MAG: hypothetical protein A3B96_04355 [Candidatus Spechtbacteria bacterium RIFCSPHIGHO2_02_FULL_43_15b]
MAFVDELKIFVKAGDGGNGVARWRHEKNMNLGGPSGGNGGNGADVYVRAVRDTHLLARYRAKREFRGESGVDGKGRSLYGKDGDTMEILLPVGSIITNLKTRKKIFLRKENERVLILLGGKGGRGNESFKSSRIPSPKKWTPGKPGEEAEFFIEVELIADIGLVGLPNAGKSSLLNELTRANAKTGNYPFTTLEPNLGDCFGYIIADIPGLIEGSSGGKGLGHKFLRHIKRTKILAHLISLENEDPAVAYNTVRKELGNFDPELLSKKEIVLLTKTDIFNNKEMIRAAVRKMKKIAPSVIALSIYDDAAIKEVREMLIGMANEKSA